MSDNKNLLMLAILCEKYNENNGMCILSKVVDHRYKRDLKKYKKEKYCRECYTTKTPLWRSGPSGLNTLCNKCGLRYKRSIKTF